MYSKKEAVIFTLCLLVTFIAYGQSVKNYYTIQLGTYTQPQLNDFANIKNYGHIYAEELPNQSLQVHLGGYTSKSSADRALKKVKAKGFSDAFVNTKNKGKKVYVVQVGSQSLKEQMNWARYLNLGRIHTLLDGTTIKLTSGVYANKQGAIDRLNTARQMGFTDAFVKEVNSNQLHLVNAFETGGLKQSATVAVMDIPKDYELMREPTYTTYAARGVNIAPKAYEAPTYKAPVVYKSSAPTIDFNKKRQSIKWLQEILQQTGTYSGVVDGRYGNETKQGFEAAKLKNYQLERFVKIAKSSVQSTHGDFRDWEDIILLMTIANNLDGDGSIDLNTDNIKALHSKPQMLDLNEQQLIVSWDYRFRRGLKNWGSTDALRAEMADALKIAYLQSQIRLEDYFIKKGFNTEKSKGLAYATLKEIVGKQIEIFQTM